MIRSANSWLLVVSVVAAVVFSAVGRPLAGWAAQDWAQWWGPNRDGVADAVEFPNQLPESLQPDWKVEVGEGHSAPVVAGCRLVVFVRQGEEKVVLCLNTENGQEIWRYSYAAPYTPRADARPSRQRAQVHPYDISRQRVCLWCDRCLDPCGPKNWQANVAEPAQSGQREIYRSDETGHPNQPVDIGLWFLHLVGGEISRASGQSNRDSVQ